MPRNYTSITVTPKAEAALRRGHPWVYDAEILSVDGAYSNGDLVDVYSQKHRYLGTGFINDFSKIRVRLLSVNANDQFDEAFFRRRITYAVDYRLTVMREDVSCCRLIFGEADSLPGLTVDRFEDVLVVQTLTLGLELRKKLLFKILLEVLAERGVQINVIYERNDVSIREKEGLTQSCNFYSLPQLTDTADGHVIITENGIRYDVDYMNGQKTGFFLDQKYNRAAAARYAPDRRVLDCFTHTGSFALNCAKAGAKNVCAVDISQDAIDLARGNAERNGLTDRMSFVCADVFDLLTSLAAQGCRDYDYIILDPPAFTKSRATVSNAARGYKEINLKAMKLLPRGGYLATCSCSHFMTEDLFRQMLVSAAQDANVSLRQVEARQQAPDHPILWNVPETNYLKFFIFQVV